jgi:hypothetical protein
MGAAVKQNKDAHIRNDQTAGILFLKLKALKKGNWDVTTSVI